MRPDQQASSQEPAIESLSGTEIERCASKIGATCAESPCNRGEKSAILTDLLLSSCAATRRGHFARNSPRSIQPRTERSSTRLSTVPMMHSGPISAMARSTRGRGCRASADDEDDRADESSKELSVWKQTNRWGVDQHPVESTAALFHQGFHPGRTQPGERSGARTAGGQDAQTRRKPPQSAGSGWSSSKRFGQPSAFVTPRTVWTDGQRRSASMMSTRRA